MGLFDSFASQAGNMIKNEVRKTGSEFVNNASSAVQNGLANAGNRSEQFTFPNLPTDVASLMALPEATLDSPFKTAALTLVALLQYENNPETCFAMIDALRGPDPMTAMGRSFIKDRMEGKAYKARSFFAGATVANNYTPTAPYTITVSSNPYSYPDPNWATLFVQSAGADSLRQIKMRLKPSTGQWFLNDIQCLSDIRTPAADDPWA